MKLFKGINFLDTSNKLLDKRHTMLQENQIIHLKKMLKNDDIQEYNIEVLHDAICDLCLYLFDVISKYDFPIETNRYVIKPKPWHFNSSGLIYGQFIIKE